MNLSKCFFLLAACLLLCLGNKVQAQNTPKYSNEFLSIGVGARGLALSKSMSAVANGATSTYWNPAGLVGIKEGGELSLMHSAYFAGIANLDYAGIGIRTGGSQNRVIGFSLVRFGIDGIPDTRFLFTADGRLDYDQVSSFSAADYAFAVSYAQYIGSGEKLSLGTNFKVVHRNVGTFANAWGAGLDIGLQYKVRKWSLGLMARDISTTYNVWSVNSEELEDVFLQTGNDIPVQSTEVTLPKLQLGMARADSISNSIGLMIALGADLTFDGQRNTLLASETASVDPYAGIELAYKKRVYIRGGVGNFQQVEEQTGAQFSFGIGIRFKTVAIDYALANIGAAVGNLNSHVFSLSFDLKKAEKK